MTVLSMLAVGLFSCEKEKDASNGNTNAMPSEVSRYTLKIFPNNAAWGTTTGSGTYSEGSRIDIEAIPVTGYYFVRWSDGAVSNPRTITISKNLTLYALFSAIQNDPNPYNPNENSGNNSSNDWVDLGLPSGVMWATHNIGANNPEDYGDYFSWGETSTKSIYNWGFYIYCNGDYDQLTKYISNSMLGYDGFVDGLLTLQTCDDAATSNYSNWARTPTKIEWQELRENCSKTWATQNGVNGYRFIASNGNSIFLPAAGYKRDSGLSDGGSSGYYWSSSLYTENPADAWFFNFDSEGDHIYGNRFRFYGHSIRAVKSVH